MHGLFATALEAVSRFDVQRQFQLHRILQRQRRLLQTQCAGDPTWQTQAKRLTISNQLRRQGTLCGHRDRTAQSFKPQLQIHRTQPVPTTRDLNLRLLQICLQGARRLFQRSTVSKHIVIRRQRAFMQAAQPGQRLINVDQNIQLATGQFLQRITPARLEIAHLPIGMRRFKQRIQQHRLQAIQATDAQQRIVLPRRRDHPQTIAQRLKCRTHIVRQPMRDQRRRHAQATLDKQRIAAQFTQAPQRIAHRRLRQAHHIGGAGDAALLVDRVEGEQQVEVELA